mmetsp:Transcript_7041/g.21463  ORF Transcript_7041/g.21463 Transcript_7041/m.21463 type:complete len:81 (+) Transcript_7041:149-391(+)
MRARKLWKRSDTDELAVAYGTPSEAQNEDLISADKLQRSSSSVSRGDSAQTGGSKPGDGSQNGCAETPGHLLRRLGSAQR